MKGRLLGKAVCLFRDNNTSLRTADHDDRKIIQILSNLFGGKISISTGIENKKADISGNTVINKGNDNITAIGNNIDLSPKIEVEKNDSSNDDYTLSIDTKNKGRI